MIQRLTKKPQDIAKKQYLELLKLIPGLKDRGKEYTTIILTLFALSFFGTFAIKPTLTTITQLQKELADSKFVEKSLREKINNLRLLNQQYEQITSDLPVVLQAIPLRPAPATLTGKIQALSKEQNITVLSVRTQKADLTTISEKPFNASSYLLAITIVGTRADIARFLSALTQMDRILAIDTISLRTDVATSQEVEATIQARAYFKQ